MWPEALELRASLARAGRRLRWIDAIEGAATGLAVAVGVALLIKLTRSSVPTGAGAVAAGALLGIGGLFGGAAISWMVGRRTRSAATEIERQAPTCRNLVITAAELIDEPTRVEPYIGEIVCSQATAIVSALDIRRAFPMTRAARLLGVMVVAWLTALVVAASAPPVAPAASTTSSQVAQINDVEVLVQPPTYTDLASRTLKNPENIDAIAGSRLTVRVKATAQSVSLETINRRSAAMAVSGKATFEAAVAADGDGFIAVVPMRAATPGARRLMGLTITPDHSPRVRITAPAKDMFLPDATQTVSISLEADDDFALASLTLRYTKVSGSGERFTFVEGDLPIALTRSTDKAWKATGKLDLAALHLDRGDMVIYRGVATDRRPGAPPTESDAFIVEIVSPLSIAASGFSVDDIEEKYALSQQMVILKTERLIAKAASMPTDSVTDQSQNIAAEQRGVRAQFVFMMGGELAEDVIASAGLDINEEAEAQGEADIAAGRMANRGRIALVQAIRSMSRASTSLNSAVLTKALVSEKAALVYLQQAFSRTRYLLRALTLRERLDLSRRLTGVLATAARDTRPAAEPMTDPKLAALRRALATVASLAAHRTPDGDAARQTAATAQAVIAIDPSAESFKAVAKTLSDAAKAFSSGRTNDAGRLLDVAATALATVVRGGLIAAPSQPSPLSDDRLAGALADALHHLGARP